MSQDLFCSKCGQDLKSPTPIQCNHAILKAMAIISKLIGEFDNPDNHAHQRSAIEDAKDYLKTA